MSQIANFDVTLLDDLQVDRSKMLQLINENDLMTAAQNIAFMFDHPDYQLLAGRVLYQHVQNQIIKPYSKALLSRHFDKFIDPALVKFVLQNQQEIERIIESDKWSHLRYGWAAMRTLQRGYIKVRRGDNGQMIALEDPRYAVMRMALHIFKDVDNPIKMIEEFYVYVSKGIITPASPTWFHAGTKYPQLKSCFLTRIYDNIESILECFNDTGLISKEGGGNGVHIAALRHSKVRNIGKSGGIVPWMQMWNQQAKAIDQGGNRKGAFTFYLPCWHKDIQAFCDLRLPEGDHDIRTHNLNICIWPSDLFFKRVLADEDWSLFDPHEAPGLDDCNGEEFERLYIRHEQSDVKRKTVKAKKLMAQIISNVIMSGEPFCMSADAANSCSNQKHMGNHTGSNLCTEIIEQTNEREIAACTLGNLNLIKFVDVDGDNRNRVRFDFEKFGQATRFLVRILTRVTETNYAPVEKINTSDRLHNPIGIGTFNFAQVLQAFDLPWINQDGTPNEEALMLKEKIWACKYFHSLAESVEIAKVRGAYPTFRGSPLSLGKFQFDLWNDRQSKLRTVDCGLSEAVKKVTSRPIVNPSDWGEHKFSWESLMTVIQKYGLAHSLLNSDQPTATQANIQGGIECFQPVTYLLYVKKVLAGDVVIWSRPFVKDVEDVVGWDPKLMVDFLKRNEGSARGLTEVMKKAYTLNTEQIERLQFLERKYATAYEIPLMTQSDFSTVSGRYVCQSTSFSYHKPTPSVKDIYNVWIYRWLSGHKTIMYYCRTEPAIDPVKYTVKQKMTGTSKTTKKVVCTDEVCTMCE